MENQQNNQIGNNNSDLILNTSGKIYANVRGANYELLLVPHNALIFIPDGYSAPSNCKHYTTVYLDIDENGEEKIKVNVYQKM